MTDSITIRPATDVDLPAVQDVAARTWRAAYAGLIPHSDIERFLADAYSGVALERTRQALDAGFLVAVHGGELVGYAMAGRNRESGPELFAISVLPERKGAGIGRRLQSGTATHLGGLGFDELLVQALAGNEPARRFYERHGTRAILEREFRVGEGTIPEVGSRAKIS